MQPLTAFDGPWVVALVCEDTHYKGQLVKGYKYNFPSEVREGRLKGQVGEPGTASSLTMEGVIGADGVAELSVSGHTGNPESTVGNLQRRSPYGYRMRGTFTPVSGKASRIELRPCEATFSKR